MGSGKIWCRRGGRVQERWGKSGREQQFRVRKTLGQGYEEVVVTLGKYESFRREEEPQDMTK